MHNVTMTLLGNCLQNTCLLTDSISQSVWSAHLKSFYSGASRVGKELTGVPGDHIAMALAGVAACPDIKPLIQAMAGFNFA